MTPLTSPQDDAPPRRVCGELRVALKDLQDTCGLAACAADAVIDDGVVPADLTQVLDDLARAVERVRGEVSRA